MTWGHRFRVIAAVAVTACAVQASIASAQDAVDVEGSADFRNPPSLVPGVYRDTIVTGEAVWYAMLYTDDTPYRFEVRLPEVDLDAQDELSVETRFVTPTLSAVDTGSTLLEGAGASIVGGGQQTFVWYLVVALNTTGRLGVEYEMILDVQGPDTARLEPCNELADCTYDEELAALDAELAQIRDDIAALDGDDTEAVFLDEIGALEAEIAAVRAESARQESSAAAANQRAEAAEREITEARADIGRVCAPEVDCVEPPAPGSSTPMWSILVASLAVVAGIATIVLGLRRRHA